MSALIDWPVVLWNVDQYHAVHVPRSLFSTFLTTDHNFSAIHQTVKKYIDKHTHKQTNE